MEYHWCTNEKCLLETEFYKTKEELKEHMNICSKKKNQEKNFDSEPKLSSNKINKKKINPEMIELLKYYNRNFKKVITIDEYKNYIKNIKFIEFKKNISKQINNYTLYYNRGHIALQTPNKVLINFIIKN